MHICIYIYHFVFSRLGSGSAFLHVDPCENVSFDKSGVLFVRRQRSRIGKTHISARAGAWRNPRAGLQCRGILRESGGSSTESSGRTREPRKFANTNHKHTFVDRQQNAKPLVKHGLAKPMFDLCLNVLQFCHHTACFCFVNFLGSPGGHQEPKEFAKQEQTTW